MVNNLDKYNEHILQANTKSNSFIANINYIARKFESLMQVDEKFDTETVELLTQLVKNSLDINIAVLAEDLRKGSYFGYRKLDIDLLTNFRDYDFYLSDEEKNKLWSDYTKQVYYKSVEVQLTEDTSEIITKIFKKPVNNHHDLYMEFAEWEEFKDRCGFTFMNISADTPLLNHELLRFVDDYSTQTETGSTPGSRIIRITLHVADDPVNNSFYNPALAGAKTNTPTFSWVSTTSALETLANKVNDIIDTANIIEKEGANLGRQFVQYLTEVQNILITVEQLKEEAENFALQAERAVAKQQSIKVQANPVSVDSNPNVFYDSANNKFIFALPKSEVAIVGLSNFSINTSNGHLIFSIRDTDDIKQAWINESGNLVLELNS